MAWFAATIAILAVIGIALTVRKMRKEKRRSIYAAWGDGGWFLVVPLALIALGFGSVAAFGGAQYAEGEYVGTPVDMASGGIFWQTTGVLLKTDKESSAMEGFCVVDPAVKEQLAEAAREERKVRVHYTTHFFWIDGCVLENRDVIRSVEVL